MEDTITAIATAMSPSGIGIVRISGPQSLEVIDRIYQPVNGQKKLSESNTHTIHYGYIVDEKQVIDEVMVLIMKAPNSYTKEDTVEIDCHGGPQVVRKILSTVTKNGARLAEPGEFTKRAFLNGRIDLSAAEAVIDLIYAKNDFARSNSISQVRGSLYRKIDEMRAKVLEETAFIEAALDDPEHYTLDGYMEKLDQMTASLDLQLQEMIRSFRNGSLLKEGIRTAIVGKPNAGKSSLLNALSGYDRAIVTDIAGTTRDTIEEQIQMNGITLNMIDTAGIRETEDVIEQIGVAKAKDSIDEADLVLYVVDGTADLDQNDHEIIKALENKPAIILLNKSDLHCKVSEQELQQLTGRSVLSISAKMQDGMEQIEKEIEQMFFDGNVSFNDEVYITNERQVNLLQNASDSLKLVRDGIANEMPEDFLSIDLMNVYEALGAIIGESVGEDLIDEVFSKFCMGK